MPEPQEQGPSVDDAAQALLGLVDQDQPEEQEEETQAVAEEEQQEEETEVEATDESEEEVEAEAEDEEVEITLSTLSGLAEALNVEPDDLLSTLKHEIDGNEVAIADIVGSYQDRKILEQHSKAYQTMEAEHQQRIEEYQKGSTILANQLNGFEKNLQDSLNSPEMANLRTTDPAEWGARVSEIQMQTNNIKMAREQAAQEYDQFITQQRNEYFKREGQRLQTDVPDWGAEKLKQATDTIKSLGFSDQEVQGIGDSRWIKGVLELNALRAENKALKEAGTKAKKIATKVKKAVPKKVLKPNAKTGKPTKGKVRKADIINIQKRLKASGNPKDAAELLLAKGVI